MDPKSTIDLKSDSYSIVMTNKLLSRLIENSFGHRIELHHVGYGFDPVRRPENYMASVTIDGIVHVLINNVNGVTVIDATLVYGALKSGYRASIISDAGIDFAVSRVSTLVTQELS